MGELAIARVELHRIAIPFKTAFKHAAHERTVSDAVIVALSASNGTTGYGEILPRPYVTGETIARVLEETGPNQARALLGLAFASKDAVLAYLEAGLDRAGRDLATFSGFEIALLDLAGKSLGFSLSGVLGGREGGELPPGVVIGFETETKALAKYCAVLRLSGKRHIKVKVGLPDDLERLRMVSSVFKQTPLRLDANGAYAGADEAIAALSAMKDAGIAIASVEQPLAAHEHIGHRRIREALSIKIMADESVVTEADARALIENKAADIFNIRLGKCGGVLGSKRLCETARASGLEVHLGTLVGETGILTRAAEVFGRSIAGFECLDGKAQNELFLTEDVLSDPRSARAADLGAPGLGVDVSQERLLKHAAEDPRVFA